jgi:hypothetical protein
MTAEGKDFSADGRAGGYSPMDHRRKLAALANRPNLGRVTLKWPALSILHLQNPADQERRTRLMA